MEHKRLAWVAIGRRKFRKTNVQLKRDAVSSTSTFGLKRLDSTGAELLVLIIFLLQNSRDCLQTFNFLQFSPFYFLYQEIQRFTLLQFGKLICSIKSWTFSPYQHTSVLYLVANKYFSLKESSSKLPISYWAWERARVIRITSWFVGPEASLKLTSVQDKGPGVFWINRGQSSPNENNWGTMLMELVKKKIVRGNDERNLYSSWKCYCFCRIFSIIHHYRDVHYYCAGIFF